MSCSSSSSTSSSSESSSESSSSSDEKDEPFSSDDSILDPSYQLDPGTETSEEEKDEENFQAYKKRKVINPTEIQKSGKKKKRNPEMWQKNQAKILRNKGEAYISIQIKKNEDGTKSKLKKVRPKKSVQPPCAEKCRLKCFAKISNETRAQIFNEYYSLGNIEKQREYIASNMSSVNPKYKYSNAEHPRKPNNAFFFIMSGTKIRVCKLFFMATLAINNRTIQTVVRKQNYSETGKVIEIDKRGKHNNHKKVDEEIKNRIRNHISTIPRIDSHYCRSRTSKEYIEGGKTLTDLHKDYIEVSKSEKHEYGNYQLYSKIFNEEHNISFHLPKKDQCEVCLEYQNATEEEKKKNEQGYNQHIREKELSRVEKDRDKQNPERNVKVLVYDLEKVLPCPIGHANSFYYVSKLNVFNFTIFDVKDTKGTCYLWHEGEGLRGPNEIGTCVFKYLKYLSEKYDAENLDIIFYSDNCSGQNKNKFILALYIYAVNTLKIKSITHKFFIKGHTQNEGDSVHARIESEITKYKKANPIYVPDQYACIIRNSKKKGNPYTVNEICFKDILDIKKLSNELYVNLRNIRFIELKVIRVEKDKPNNLFYKYSYDESYMKTDIISERKCINFYNITLSNAFSKKPGISEKKKKGLLELIEKKKCVPLYYLDFFKNL